MPWRMNSRLIVLIALSCPSQIGTAVSSRTGWGGSSEVRVRVRFAFIRTWPKGSPETAGGQRGGAGGRDGHSRSNGREALHRRDREDAEGQGVFGIWF